jgi:hypothetical protein
MSPRKHKKPFDEHNQSCLIHSLTAHSIRSRSTGCTSKSDVICFAEMELRRSSPFHSCTICRPLFDCSLSEALLVEQSAIVTDCSPGTPNSCDQFYQVPFRAIVNSASSMAELLLSSAFCHLLNVARSTGHGVCRNDRFDWTISTNVTADKVSGCRTVRFTPCWRLAALVIVSSKFRQQSFHSTVLNNYMLVGTVCGSA